VSVIAKFMADVCPASGSEESIKRRTRLSQQLWLLNDFNRVSSDDGYGVRFKETIIKIFN